jgi:hypothetical protein
MKNFCLWQISGLLATVALFSGCSSDELGSANAIKLETLGRVYLDFWAATGRGPADEAELLAHCERAPHAFFGARGEVDRANLLRSSADGLPFIVRYGQSVQRIGAKSQDIIAHEPCLRDGGCLVLFANGQVDHIEEDALPGDLQLVVPQ